MIPPSFKQDLLARADIVEIVGRHVQLKKAGINFKGLCPFHGEKTPSFIVSPTRQTYHCFGCGVHGSAIDFLMENSGLSFVDAVKDLAQQYGLAVPDDDSSPQDRAQAAQARERQQSQSDVLAKALEHYRKQLRTSERAIAYLKGRGLTGEIAARFGLGYAPEGWRGLAGVFPRYDDPLLEESGLVITQGEGEDAKRYDRFRDRVMFPIRSVKGEVIGFGGRVLDQGEPKYLNSPETPIFVKGRELYGLYEARTALRKMGYVLVVEGYMDVVALAQLGFPNAVATLGTACTAEHVQKLFRFTDSVVFSFDGDAAGRKAAARALEAALPHANDTRSVRFLFLPPEHDPDSYVREHGMEAFALCVNEAVPLSRQLVDVAREGCDLATAEGRARMLAQARPLWQTLPDGAFRQQLLGELAQHGGLSAADLLGLWQGSPPHRAGRERNRDPNQNPGGARRTPGEGRAGGSWGRRSVKQAPAHPAEHAVRMLLANSGWWHQLSPEDHELLHELDEPFRSACNWLERMLEEHGELPWSALKDSLPEGEAWVATVERLAVADSPDETFSYEEMRVLLDRMKIEALKQEETRLIEQAARQPQALQRYREVLERRRELERQHDAHARKLI